MRHAWVRRPDPGQSLAVLSLIAACTALAGAQEPPRTQPPAVARSIILPTKVVAGAEATLAIVDSQGRLLPNIAVELSGGQKITTDAAGRALFSAPSGAGMLVAKVSGSALTASTPLVAADQPGHDAAGQSVSPGTKVLSYPHVLIMRDRFTLEGVGFRGAADSNRVFLAGQLCLVVASSPDSLVVVPGLHVPIGEVQLRVRVDGREAEPTTVSVVLLEITGAGEVPTAGAIGKLVLHAYGTSERLTVEVRNASPRVIQLPKGNVQRLTTSGGEPNTAPVEVKFVTAGDYSVSARLLSSAGGLPDVESVRRNLLKAREIASGSWPARIDRVLLQIDTAPADLAQIRAELRTMLNDRPSASLAALLDSAWRELQQNN
jgi:hypothetical protein